MTEHAELHFHIGDMTCNHCVQTITSAIEQAIPGARVTADLQQHTIVVNGTAEKARLMQIIEKEGYTPQAL